MPGAAIASYGISAIAFTLLTFFLLSRVKIRAMVPGLWIASLCMVAWSVTNVLFAIGRLDIHWILGLEVCRQVSWCYCLLSIFKFYPQTTPLPWFENKYVKRGLLLLAVVVIEAITWIPTEFQVGWPQTLIKSIFVANLLFVVFGLSLVEQLFRHIKPQRRWGFKFLTLGLGCMFCYDFYMIADALLLSNVDPALWQARGVINALVAPLLAISVVRNRNWQTDIFPSRQAVFHSTVIVGCGLYLLAMAALGYYIRDHGGSWGRAFQTVFLVGAMILLTSLLISGKIRAWFKMMLGKYLFQYRYDYRKEWLKFSRMLSHQDIDVDLRLRVIMALADMVESPSGVLLECNTQNLFTITKAWNDTCKTITIPAQILLENFGENQSVLLFKQIKSQAVFSDIKEPWLVIALYHQEQHFAFVILSQPRVKLTLNWEVLDLLQMAGRQAAVSLKQEQVSEQLLTASQFESLNRMSAFLMHDLKNIYSQLKLIQTNYKKHAQNPEFIKSAFSNLEHVNYRLENLLNELRSRQTQTALETVRVKSIIERVINERSGQRPIPKFIQKADPLIQGNQENLVSCLTHLVENAQEATHINGGEVTVILEVIAQTVKIEIQDTGSGMSQEFIREELFKPFATTKGKNGMGIGVFQAREIIKSLQGTLQVESILGEGSKFTILFPVHCIEPSTNSVEIEQNIATTDDFSTRRRTLEIEV